MRIFPEGTEEWIRPSGVAMFILGCFGLAIGLVAFSWRYTQWKQWPRTEGQVVQAEVSRSKSEEGTEMCGLNLTVQYVANSKRRTLKSESLTKTNNCETWQDQANSAQGSRQQVIYDPSNPYNGYLVSNKSHFFVGGFVPFALGTVFCFAGIFLHWLGGRLTKRGLQLP